MPSDVLAVRQLLLALDLHDVVDGDEALGDGRVGDLRGDGRVAPLHVVFQHVGVDGRVHQVLVTHREVVVQLDQLRIEQKAEERLEQLLVGQEDPLRRALVEADILVVQELQGLSIIDL